MHVLILKIRVCTEQSIFRYVPPPQVSLMRKSGFPRSFCHQKASSTFCSYNTNKCGNNAAVTKSGSFVFPFQNTFSRSNVATYVTDGVGGARKKHLGPFHDVKPLEQVKLQPLRRGSPLWALWYQMGTQQDSCTCFSALVSTLCVPCRA